MWGDVLERPVVCPPERVSFPLGPDRPPRQRRVLGGVRSLRVRGAGRIVLVLDGTGHVAVQRGRFDDFSFEGRGLPKHLSAEQVQLDRVEGTVVLEGMELDLRFRGGRADAELDGRFEIEQAR